MAADTDDTGEIQDGIRTHTHTHTHAAAQDLPTQIICSPFSNLLKKLNQSLNLSIKTTNKNKSKEKKIVGSFNCQK